jgi:hypothetical protein
MTTKRKAKTEKILASISDTKAAYLARLRCLSKDQVKSAFNCYDNVVISGVEMSIAEMGKLFRQCVNGANDVHDLMVWNRLARDFKDNYNFLRRKRWS